MESSNLYLEQLYSVLELFYLDKAVAEGILVWRAI